MGILEEFRDLTLMEWNFKSILENRLISLLRQQKIYWKQRSTMRWVTKGDASTNFFHANATIRHRKNFITSLEESTGVSHTEHNVKASILLDAYKEMLGQTEFGAMLQDLDLLLSQSMDFVGS